VQPCRVQRRRLQTRALERMKAEFDSTQLAE
jgi:hypothetical protein